MAKKSAARIDELLEQLKDDRVTETLLVRLTDAFMPIIEGIVNRLFDAFAAKLESNVEKTSKESINRHAEIQEQKMAALGEEINMVKSRIEVIEVDARLNNLIIHGIEESSPLAESNEPRNDRPFPRSNQEATLAVLELCNTRLGINVAETDISTAFRLQRKGKDKFRPILVKFTTQRVRDMVYMARLSLRNRSSTQQHSALIYINEHLTKQNAQYYAKARSLVNQKKISSAWTSAGYVYVRLLEDQGGKKLKISSHQILEEYGGPLDNTYAKFT